MTNDEAPKEIERVAYQLSALNRQLEPAPKTKDTK